MVKLVYIDPQKRANLRIDIKLDRCEFVNARNRIAQGNPPSTDLWVFVSNGVACGKLAGVETTAHHIQFFHRYVTPRRRRFTGIIILLCNHLAKLYIQSVYFTSNSSFAYFLHHRTKTF